jgi:hypothetical protein
MRRLAALLVISLIAAACGDSDKPDAATTTAAAPATTAAAPATTAEEAPATTAESPPSSTEDAVPVPPELERVVRGWSEAVNRNDNAAAAAFFAPGAIARQSQEYQLVDAEVATLWNDGLPCAGTVVDLRMVDVAVVATFVLGQRPEHQCDAPGARAGAAFVIKDGLIVLWQQVAIPDDQTPAPTASTSTSPVA